MNTNNGSGWSDAMLDKAGCDVRAAQDNVEAAGWLVIRNVASSTDEHAHGSFYAHKTESGTHLFAAYPVVLTDEQAFKLLEWLAARFGMEIMRDILPNAETRRRMIALVEKATIAASGE